MMKDPCAKCKVEYPHCRRICPFGVAYQAEKAQERDKVRAARNEEATLAEYKFDRIADTKKKLGLE